jgi:hypothetical protein
LTNQPEVKLATGIDERKSADLQTQRMPKHYLTDETDLNLGKLGEPIPLPEDMNGWQREFDLSVRSICLASADERESPQVYEKAHAAPCNREMISFEDVARGVRAAERCEKDSSS